MGMARRASVLQREPSEAKPVEMEPASSDGSRAFYVCLLLFAGSGCAALIYEIVWFQLLQLVIGSSAISLGLLLAAYMGGLCLGSLLLPRFVSVREHPLRVYAYLELAIGVCGIVALFGVPLIGRIYVAGAASMGLFLRALVAFVCLLPPTALMGASLPAISRGMRTTPNGISRLGLLYSFNVAGAVWGCLLAGFYLLRVYDMGVATYAAAAINFAVAGAALWIAGRVVHVPPASERSPANRAPGAGLIYLAIGLSGFSALGAEITWTRVLSLLLGATVYTFSIILAVFLAGLWAGSCAGSSVARRIRNPRWCLAGCQILLAAGIAWTALSLAYVLPYWPVDPWLSVNPWLNFDLDITRCLRTIFPATLLWGASFPLALACAVGEDEDPARLSGEVYAANTLGSIVGVLLFALILIPWIGTSACEQVLIWLAVASAAAAVVSVWKAAGTTKAVGVLALAVLIGWALSSTTGAVPWQAIAYGRRVAPILRGFDTADLLPPQPLFVGEGRNASVAIAQRGDQRFFYVSGKSEASSAPLDMRLQRMMGHLPALLHSGPPRSALVVGFGAGVTAGSLTRYPEVRSIAVCELERLIPPASDQYFGKENYHVLQDPRTRVVYDDARHFVLTAPDKFDVITTDPIHPWVKGTSTLYSKEYYELVKAHLNPGGVAAQWLPIYESDEETVKSELATFFSVFPDGTVWSNYANGDGYDLVLIGRAESVPIDVDALQRRLDQPAYAPVAASIAEVGFHSATDLIGSYAGRGRDLAPLLSRSAITNDLNLRLQYLAGLGLNSRASAKIYSDLLSYRTFPEDLFTGGARLSELRTAMGRPHRVF